MIIRGRLIGIEGCKAQPPGFMGVPAIQSPTAREPREPI